MSRKREKAYYDLKVKSLETAAKVVYLGGVSRGLHGFWLNDVVLNKLRDDKWISKNRNARLCFEICVNPQKIELALTVVESDMDKPYVSNVLMAIQMSEIQTKMFHAALSIAEHMRVKGDCVNWTYGDVPE